MRVRTGAALLAALFALTLPAQGQTPEAAVPAATPALSEPSAPAAIALPEVATRAESSAAQLREIATRIAPLSAVTRIEENLPNLTTSIDDHQQETLSALADDAVSLDFLADLESEWRSRQQALASWVKVLTERATVLEAELASLAEMRALWEETRKTARESDAPAAIRERIDGILAAIATAEKQVAQRRDAMLTLQSRGSAQQTRVAETLEQVRAARKTAVGHLFAAADEPVWSADFRSGLRDDLSQDFAVNLGSQWDEVRTWAAERGSVFGLHVLLTLGLALLLLPARRRVRTAQEAGPGLEQAGAVFERPLQTALLLSLLISPWAYPQAPRLVLQLLYAAVLVPAVLLLRRLVAAPLRPLLYAAVGFFFLDRVRQILEPLRELERSLFLAELALAIAILLWLGRPSRLERIPPDAARSPVLRRVGLAARIGLAALGVALFAGALGYGRLAVLIGDAVFGSAYAAVVAYAAVRITAVLWRFSLRVEPLRSLNMVVRHRSLLERRGDRILRVAGLAGWVWVTLGLLSLARPGLDAVRASLAAELSVGAASLSLGDLLAFVLTVWAAFLISRFLRFVLEEDVFPRTRLRRGMPYALSTLLHYAILLFGFLLAVAASGVNLDRIAFLAGAFGVGLGFGLQNVVNNFVSGLILLFERPIQRGDMVQMNDLWGEVRRIGIRASVVRTFDGAEVIVPNGNLISERVTNWTLSDRYRRVEFDVGVAYGNDPERVIEILKTTAVAHADVLSTPEPVALFLGFGDSALNFRLQAWIGEFDKGLRTRSELAVAVNRALAEAGIEIPFPQRDLHLRSSEVPLGPGAPEPSDV